MSHTSFQTSSRHNREADGRQENKEQRIQRAATLPGGYLWPELRVGREADFEGEYELEWNHYQNRLSRKNRRRGSAKTLGEISCHYLTDKEMRGMILDRYDKASRGRSEAMKIYRGVEKSLANFILDMQVGASFRMNPGQLDERPELMGKSLEPGSKVDDTALFQSASLKVRTPEEGGVIGLDTHRLGFDLSDNNMLAEERNEIIKFLRREEGLNTKRFVRNDWTPHAAVFDIKDHLRVDDVVMRWPADTPPQMEFGPVRTINGDGLSGK